METYSGIAVPHKSMLHLLDKIIVWCFVVEITMKIISHGKKPFDYFRDPWNVFDFIIVAVCLFPMGDVHFVAILRIARILRVLRMITLFPKLQLLIGALLKSVPSMGYVILLLSLLFYIYGVMGSFLFGQNDPLHFGNLHLSPHLAFPLFCQFYPDRRHDHHEPLHRRDHEQHGREPA